MNKMWIIILGIGVIAIIAFFVINKVSSEKEITTEINESTSEETNGLLGAITSLFGGVKNLFSSSVDAAVDASNEGEG